MQLHLTVNGDLLEVAVEGELDNEASSHFRDAIDEAVRDGWYRVLVDLDRVTFLSSAGIGALLAARQRFVALHGSFGVCRPAPPVERILAQTNLLGTLVRDAETFRAHRSTGGTTLHTKGRMASRGGVDLQIYGLSDDASLRCQLYGDPDPLFNGTYVAQQCSQVMFSPQTIGVGLGALADDFNAAWFGEFLAVGGAVAQSPMTEGSLPDYLVRRGDYTPQVQVLYGLRCEGEFSDLLRFTATEPGRPIGFANLVDQALQATGRDAAGFAMLAESAGLVGTRLRQSPTTLASNSGGRFAFPQVREWLSLSLEPVYHRALALVVGVARRTAVKGTLAAVDPLLRPLDAAGELLGHFHAAVFPYRPLKKRTLDLDTSVAELFDSGTIQDVLHLLRDDRPISGGGESEFFGGGCWLAPIGEVSIESG